MTTFARAPQVTRTVALPCCDALVTLAADEFVHDGRPRKADSTYMVWTVRCDCGTWHRIGIEAPLRATRAAFSTRYETRRHLRGAHHFVTD